MRVSEWEKRLLNQSYYGNIVVNTIPFGGINRRYYYNADEIGIEGRDGLLIIPRLPFSTAEEVYTQVLTALLAQASEEE